MKTRLILLWLAARFRDVCAALFVVCLLLAWALHWRPLGELDVVDWQPKLRWTTPPQRRPGEPPPVMQWVPGQGDIDTSRELAPERKRAAPR